MKVTEMATKDSAFVLFFLLIFCVGCVYCENVKTGTRYTFKPAIAGTIQFGDWRHNSNLVVEWEEKTSSHPTWYRYRDRAQLDPDNGDLTIQLKKEDSGLFKAQIQVGGALKYFQSSITVFDPVSKPTVTCEQNETNITLKCTVNPPVPKPVTWSGPNGFSHTGETVQITSKPNGDPIYYCTAENEVSSESTEFRLKDCSAKGPTKDQSNAGAVVGGIFGGLVAVVLSALGIIWVYKTKCSSRAAHGKDSKLTGGDSEMKSPTENQTSNNHSPDDGADVPLSQGNEPENV